jgi:hypothetical protein
MTSVLPSWRQERAYLDAILHRCGAQPLGKISENISSSDIQEAAIFKGWTKVTRLFNNGVKKISAIDISPLQFYGAVRAHLKEAQ